jgi:hypothetical protein
VLALANRLGSAKQLAWVWEWDSLTLFLTRRHIRTGRAAQMIEEMTQACRQTNEDYGALKLFSWGTYML